MPRRIGGRGGVITTVGRGTGNTMSWNRWTARVLGGVLALSGLGGCKQQLFMEPGDYSDAVRLNLPKNLETNPHDAILPPLVDRPDRGPATVIDPSRPARYLTLRECVAIALEQGNIGVQNFTQFGNKSETLATFF